jgi:hypothetical protein
MVTGVLEQHLREHRLELEQIDQALSPLKGVPPLSSTRI